MPATHVPFTYTPTHVRPAVSGRRRKLTEAEQLWRSVNPLRRRRGTRLARFLHKLLPHA